MYFLKLVCVTLDCVEIATTVTIFCLFEQLLEPSGVTNLNKPLRVFLLPPYDCRLGAGSIPFRAIVNNKQCEMRGLFMSLVIRHWIGDVQDSQGVSASEMTYIVSGGALNSTHSPRAILYKRLALLSCCSLLSVFQQINQMNE